MAKPDTKADLRPRKVGSLAASIGLNVPSTIGAVIIYRSGLTPEAACIVAASSVANATLVVVTFGPAAAESWRALSNARTHSAKERRKRRLLRARPRDHGPAC